MSNISISNTGELIFGGSVAASGGIAKAPLALGQLRSNNSNSNGSSSSNTAQQRQQAAFSHQSATSSLPARATLRHVPGRPISASLSGSNSNTRSPTPIAGVTNMSSSFNSNNHDAPRQEQIDALLARSRAAAPTPGLNSTMDRPNSRMMNATINAAAYNNRSGSPNSVNNNNKSTSSLFASGYTSPLGCSRRLGERGVLQAEDFDVTTDEAVLLNSTGIAAGFSAGGGRPPGGGAAVAGAGAGAAAAASDPQSRVSTAAQRPLHVPYAPTVRTRTGVVDVMPPLCLKDYILLAEACQRAGRARVEGTAYFKIAHLLSGDEEQKPRAASYLRKFLQICRRINDLQGEAKALNALGIVHYELALASAAPGSQQSQMLLRVALGFHRQHAEIADAAGIFIANTNAGLCHSQLGDHAAAAEAHKLAASFAVQAGDRDAEALALSNLAAAATSTGDLATSRLCAQRQLDVGIATQNAGVSCEAHEQLAQLAIHRSDFATATTHLVSALEVALKEGDQRRALRLRCQLGVAQAAAGIENKMQEQASHMDAQ